MTTPRFRRSGAALSANVGDDIVALHVESGHCFGMTEVSAAVWQLLAEPIAAESICEALRLEYEIDAETCRADVTALVDRLRGEGLVEEVP